MPIIKRIDNKPMVSNILRLSQKQPSNMDLFPWGPTPSSQLVQSESGGKGQTIRTYIGGGKTEQIQCDGNTGSVP